MPMITNGPFNGGAVTTPVTVAAAGGGGSPSIVAQNTSAGATDAVFQCLDAFTDVIVNVDADNINAVASKVEISGQLSAQATDDATANPVQALRSKNSLGIGVGRHGEFVMYGVTAIPDAELGSSQVSLWLDATIGATKLMVKARDSGGTLRTAAIALT